MQRPFNVATAPSIRFQNKFAMKFPSYSLKNKEIINYEFQFFSSNLCKFCFRRVTDYGPGTRCS